MADSQDKQKEQIDAKGRSRIEMYEVGDQVLLNATNIPTNEVSAVFKTKLLPRFIGLFTVVDKKVLVYTLSLPCKLRTHPVFYLATLRRIGIYPRLIGRRLRRETKLTLPQVAKSG